MHGDLRLMSIEDLWSLYESLTIELRQRVADEKAKLEDRLRKIESGSNVTRLERLRRPYPKVLPKYQNPKNPAETWSGRGKQPHWVKVQLKAGKTLKHFLITRQSVEKSSARQPREQGR
jgi:DNA-binding protein H-NS